MKSINIGIIGVGAVGERFIKALNRHGKAEIIGIYDTNQERLVHIADTYELDTANDYIELVESGEIDVIYLAVPPRYHHPIAMDIIQAGKDIICEKPLANSIEEAEEMYETAEEQGIVHAMNFPVVYTPALKKIKSLLEQGFLGDLRRIELHGYFEEWPRFWQQNSWIDTREQGGFVREVFTHFVQMTQMLFGRITDIDTNINYPDNSEDCETGIIATGYLNDGTPMLFNGISNIGMKDELSFTMYGTDGTLSLVNWRELWKSTEGEERTQVELPEHDHLVELIDEAFKAIETGEGKVISFEDGYQAQIVIENLLGNADA